MILSIWFKFLMILGTMISISSNNWLNCWLGLEMNLMAFIPLLFNPKKLKSVESSLIYFLFQSLASLIFISASLFFFYLNLLYMFSYFISISLLMKIGSVPFHYWMLLVMENLSWISSLILMSWQKIAPFIILFNCFNNKIIYLFIALSSILSATIGMNQTSLQKMMGYSSINHISWMLSTILISKFLWFCYFLFYLIILFTITMVFYKFNLFFLNQIFTLWKNYFLKMIIFFNFLSMGGLPPFLGFFPKMLVINNLISNNYFLIVLILVLFTLITLFYYLRILFFVLFLNSLNLKIYFLKSYSNKIIIYLNLLNNLTLMILFLTWNI